MTRFAWLQSRGQTMIAAGVLAALAIAAAITGIHLSHLYASLVTHCQSNCSLATSQFLNHDHFMDHLLTIVSQVAAPLLGIFWGAPMLAREFETGTFRLVWTQSVSRSRWLLTKLAVVGVATIIAAGVLTLTITWWYRSLDPLTTNQFLVFGQRDIAPIGYALFAFASGALLGAILRRTLPAMAATIAVFVFVRIAISAWVRPHLLTPLHQTMPLGSGGQVGFVSSNGGTPVLVAQGSVGHNAWSISSHIMTSSGQVASSRQLAAFVAQNCPGIGPPSLAPGSRQVGPANPAPFHDCMLKASQTFHLAVTYLPANRYWTLQWLETAIFVALALIAAAGCYWWVTRRAT